MPASSLSWRRSVVAALLVSSLGGGASLAETAPLRQEALSKDLRSEAPRSEAPPQAPAALPDLAEVLGAPLGERFTAHADLLRAFDALAAASDLVTIEEYGRSIEGRPLRLAVLTRAGDPDRLAAASWAFANRPADPSLARPSTESALDDLPAVLWFGFGVHGDEASSPEAALAIAWELAAAGPDRSPELWKALEDVVVLIDIAANPDGRERYVSWLTAVSGVEADPDPQALEHRPPWPGGRGNHYLFDLNRDWSWLTQPESRQRLDALRRWEPHVVVDFHEMGSEASYFFPPPADPVHPSIDAETLAWLDVFGRGNAAAFDERGWLYFVRDVYDFFYPGYGDTYPTLRGGLGMTYEMAGGWRAGRALDLRDGGRLTLADRLARHTVAGFATIQTAAERRRELLEASLERARGHQPSEWIWRADQAEAHALATLLADHGFWVERTESAERLTVEPLLASGLVERRFPAGSYRAAASGRMAPLLDALMEREPRLDPEFLARQATRRERGLDAEMYDLTAWSLPLAYGIEAWRRAASSTGSAAPRAERPVSNDGPVLNFASAGRERPNLSLPPGERPAVDALAWTVPPQGLAGYRLISDLVARDVPLRWATEPLDDQPAGTVVVPRHGAPGEFASTLGQLATAAGARITNAGTSWADSGRSLGASSTVPIRRSRIGLVGGEGIEETAHGHLWFLLDAQVGLAPSRRLLERLDDRALLGLDVLVLPDGAAWNALDESTSEAIVRWTRLGGTLVAIERAAAWVARDEAFELEIELRSGEDSLAGDLDLPGAVFATEAGPGPLAAGAGSPPLLFRGGVSFAPSDDPQVDLLRLRSRDPLLAGLVWESDDQITLAGAAVVSQHDVGRGRVVLFAQDPAFRGFWRGTMPLFLNTVLFGPSL